MHDPSSYFDLTDIGSWVGVDSYPDDNEALMAAIRQLKQDKKIKPSGNRYAVHPDWLEELMPETDEEEALEAEFDVEAPSAAATPADAPQEITAEQIKSMLSNMPPGMPVDADFIRSIFPDDEISDEVIAQALDKGEAGLLGEYPNAKPQLRLFLSNWLPNKDADNIEGINEFEDLFVFVEDAFETIEGGEDAEKEYDRLRQQSADLLETFGARLLLPSIGGMIDPRFHEVTKGDGDVIMNVESPGYRMQDGTVEKAKVHGDSDEDPFDEDF